MTFTRPGKKMMQSAVPSAPLSTQSDAFIATRAST